MPPSTSAPAPTRPGSLLALAVWAGIVTGFGELAKVGLDLFHSDFTFRSRDALWMIPAFDSGLFALVGLVLLAIGRWVRVPWPVAAGLFASLGAALILLLIERLHPAAALVLAAGVGTQTARLVQSRVAVATRLVRRTLPWLAGLVCLIGGLTVGWRAANERFLARARPAAAPGSPNVLLLLLDTVRAADLSLYGYPRRTTPELERFAERGTVFDRARCGLANRLRRAVADPGSRASRARICHGGVCREHGIHRLGERAQPRVRALRRLPGDARDGHERDGIW